MASESGRVTTGKGAAFGLIEPNGVVGLAGASEPRTRANSARATGSPAAGRPSSRSAPYVSDFANVFTVAKARWCLVPELRFARRFGQKMLEQCYTDVQWSV